MSALLVGLAALVLALYDVPPLVRRRLWGELAAVSVILALGLALALPYSLHRDIPDPLRVLGPVVAWLRRVISRLRP